MCVVIFTVATVAKTLAAKLAASSFHRQAHFDKMQDALSKVGCRNRSRDVTDAPSTSPLHLLP